MGRISDEPHPVIPIKISSISDQNISRTQKVSKSITETLVFEQNPSV